MDPDDEAPPRTRWWIVLAVWTVPALISVFERWQAQLRTEEPADWAPILSTLVFWYLWALATPPLLALVRRVPVAGSPRWGRAILVHLVAAGATALVLGTAVVAADVLLGTGMEVAGEGSFPEKVARFVFRASFGFLVIYSALAAVGTALEMRRKLLRAELRRTRLETQNAQLERRLAESRLAALRTQLQPHFLFNTLHAVSSLMDEDVPAARNMIARLSDLLRTTLDGEAEVPLAEEIEGLERFLDIERVRLGERLRLVYAVDDDALDVRVPSLLLQPLVENAVRYAVAPRRDGGEIAVGAHLENGTLSLSVADDGPGVDAESGEGIGLANTRARLAELYGEAGTLLLSTGEAGGLAVEVRIPAVRATD